MVFLRNEANLGWFGPASAAFCGTKALTAMARSPKEVKIGAEPAVYGFFGLSRA
jgi:hypothetical protein